MSDTGEDLKSPSLSSTLRGFTTTDGLDTTGMQAFFSSFMQKLDQKLDLVTQDMGRMRACMEFVEVELEKPKVQFTDVLLSPTARRIAKCGSKC